MIEPHICYAFVALISAKISVVRGITGECKYLLVLRLQTLHHPIYLIYFFIIQVHNLMQFQVQTYNCFSG